jgi:hypothetical protein
MNLDLDAAVVKWRIQISELEEMRLKAYENASIYKERIKRWYDERLNKKELCHTLKFPNFRMWIEEIIKQEFSHNFKKFLNIYFVYRKSSIGKNHCLIFWIKINWFDVSVEFVLMHLGASWVQKVSKVRLGAVQILPRIFRTFLGFILVLLWAISIY